MKKIFLILVAIIGFGLIGFGLSTQPENSHSQESEHVEWKIEYDNGTHLGHNMYVYYGHYVLYENGKVIEEKPDHCYKLVNRSSKCLKITYEMKNRNGKYSERLMPGTHGPWTLNGSSDQITRYSVEACN